MREPQKKGLRASGRYYTSSGIRAPAKSLCGTLQCQPTLGSTLCTTRCLEVRCVPPWGSPEGGCRGTVGWLCGCGDAPLGRCVPISPGCQTGAVLLSLEGAQIRAQALEEVFYLLSDQITGNVSLWDNAGEECRTGHYCHWSSVPVRGVVPLGCCTPVALEGSAVPPSKGPKT